MTERVPLEQLRARDDGRCSHEDEQETTDPESGTHVEDPFSLNGSSCKIGARPPHGRTLRLAGRHENDALRWLDRFSAPL
jgi:hypothetical protein